MNDKLADDRKVEGFKQFLAGIVSVTVGTALILATAGTAAPIVFLVQLLWEGHLPYMDYQTQQKE